MAANYKEFGQMKIVCSRCGYKENVIHPPEPILVKCPSCGKKHFPKRNTKMEKEIKNR